MPAAAAAPAESGSVARCRVRRLKQRAGFERALGAGPQAIVARSPHFMLHFVPAAELSTGQAPGYPPAVDCQAGAVLPKRWARRAVTRNLLKRQVYACFERHAGDLPAGIWVVRLRAAFDREQFRSSASEVLKRAARQELDALLAQGAARARRQLAAPPAST